MSFCRHPASERFHVAGDEITIGGVPVWAEGAIATTLDGLAPGYALRGVSTPTVSRVDLFEDH